MEDFGSGVDVLFGQSGVHANHGFGLDKDGIKFRASRVTPYWITQGLSVCAGNVIADSSETVQGRCRRRGKIGSSLIRIRTDTDIGIVREGEVVEINIRGMFSPIDIITLMRLIC